MNRQLRPVGRVLRNLRHGGQVLPDDAPNAEETADNFESVSVLSSAVPGEDLQGLELAEVSTPFDYLFDDLAAQFPAQHLPGEPAAVTAALKQLGETLAEPAPPRGEELQASGNSTIPAVYTYWGQFIDHDITARTDRPNEVGHVTDEAGRPGRPRRRQRERHQRAGAGAGPRLGLRRRPHLPGRAGHRRQGHLRRHQAARSARSRWKASRARTPTSAESGSRCSRPGAGPAPRRRAGCPDQGQHRRQPQRREPDRRPAARGLPAVPQRHGRLGAQARAVLRPTRPCSTGPSSSSAGTTSGCRARLPDARSRCPGVVDEVLLGGNTQFTPSATARSGCRWSSRSRRSASATRWCAARTTTTATSARPRPVIAAPLRSAASSPSPARRRFNGADRRAAVQLGDRVGPVRRARPALPDHFARKIDTRLADALGDMVNQSQGDEADPSDQGRSCKHLAVRNLLRGYQLVDADRPGRRGAARAGSADRARSCSDGNSGERERTR